MKKKTRTIYYTDELNDEFAGDSIEARTIDGSYVYLRRSVGGRLMHILWYRIIAIPLAWCYMKLYFGHRVVNKSVLKQAGHTGWYMYGNHTHFMADALVPTMVNMPVDVSVIVHPNNVSMPVLGRITPYLGAMPLPGDAAAAKNFVRALAQRMKDKACIMIYPEAHIWPYYTHIRPFKADSFRYPVKSGAPVFALTNTYQKRRFTGRPRMVTYIDGPFYPDKSLSGTECRRELRDRVYNAMVERSTRNEVERIRYVRSER